ncbi:deoxyguanosinetriphosphate triphosphohydrolase [Allosphingosinicella flava]|uniref:Deoxyguanosinetriphosphate triphosphohydrolase-like protein n=1 Tax=Allosphingosinicella flava TaxID=2771430 RepID=A0A7T2GLV5_9SPHN|nr:deoxyguanosinetriphosphate triphosphohydrolase [Sphingosinicella flava]QPQ56278.1 deoxyguanosinetriphosphate triphosphohydrolase [Sphingosinicella flava]
MRPLAPYASDPARSRGRLHPEAGGETRGPRDAFQRDRDRIIHSIPFRRLRHKTQVFVAPDGDHFRVRLTHSLEVAQIGRTLARALGLNEDLTEALCLAHDIGHPPFGHSGEDALQEAMAEAGGFDHNANTIRQLTKMESPYPRFDGLNLTWETLEGLAKHNGPVTRPTWAMREANAAFPLDLETWPSLEAQIAAIADDIAYDNHDIDDGIRAGLIALDDVLEVPFVADSWDTVRRRYPDVPAERLRPELIREQIGRMVNDVLVETRRRVAEAGVSSADGVRQAGRQLGGFSEAMAERERALKTFLYARIYRSPPILAVQDTAKGVLARLFAVYRDNPSLLPPEWAADTSDRTRCIRRIGDFIAGMTDRYAISRHEELIGPVELPEGF